MHSQITAPPLPREPCAEAEGIVVEGWQADSNASSVRASMLTFAQGFAAGERARLASWWQHVVLGEMLLLKFALWHEVKQAAVGIKFTSAYVSAWKR